MEQELYRKLIDDVNAHRIEGFVFSIQDYNHYKRCVCHYVYEDIPALQKRATTGIEFALANNEKCIFCGPINEGIKFFRIKGENKLSLSAIYPRMNLIEIIPLEEK